MNLSRVAMGFLLFTVNVGTNETGCGGGSDPVDADGGAGGGDDAGQVATDGGAGNTRDASMAGNGDASTKSDASDQDGAVPPGTSPYGYRGTPGIPLGTTLSVLGNGDYKVTTPGTHLHAVHITGGLTINADNVTVDDSHIEGPGGDDFAVIIVNGNNVTITHNLIGNSNNQLSGHQGVALYAGGANKVTGNEFIHTHGGIALDGGGKDTDSVLFQDNYVHAMTAQAKDHMNIISGTCASNVTIDHNTLDGHAAPGSQADTAFIQSAYSEDPSCPATASSPYVRASDNVRIGAIKNLTFSHNDAFGENSWGLFYPDIIGTVVVTDNKLDPGPYGPIDSPTYVPFTGSGNIDDKGVAYPKGSINN